MTHVPVHGQVALQIGLHLSCRFLPRQPGWPTDNSRVMIELAGYAKPATFTFAGLFGFNIGADLRQACDPAS